MLKLITDLHRISISSNQKDNQVRSFPNKMTILIRTTLILISIAIFVIINGERAANVQFSKNDEELLKASFVHNKIFNSKDIKEKNEQFKEGYQEIGEEDDTMDDTQVNLKTKGTLFF